MNWYDPNRWSVLGRELASVSPELCLAVGMCLVLLWPVLRRGRNHSVLAVAMWSLVAALAFSVWTLIQVHPFWAGKTSGADALGGMTFSGMFVIDGFSQFFKVMLNLLAMMVLAQWAMFSKKSMPAHRVPDYFCLILGAVLGMSLMVSAANLLMIFLVIEMASLSSYVLVGFHKSDRLASEASLKYVIYGSVASAIMLYGMSLIYGCTGSLGLGAVVYTGHRVSLLLALGWLGVLVGLAFKMSAVPMHFWTPDVFQAAPIEVATLLSVASKGAAICLLTRIIFNSSLYSPWWEAFGVMGVIGALGALTSTWGNIAALRQHQIRRILAYSSIAHAGYMMLAIAAMAMAHAQGRGTAGIILFYLLVYLFMNLGAFTVVGVIRQHLGTEDVRQYIGLGRRNPWLAVLMTVFMLSLFGMPVLGGFMAKIYLASGLLMAGSIGLVLVVVLFANTLLSLFYYLKPVYYMLVAKDDGSAKTEDDGRSFIMSLPAACILGVCAVMVLWTGLLPGPLQRLTEDWGHIRRTLPTMDFSIILSAVKDEQQALHLAPRPKPTQSPEVSP